MLAFLLWNTDSSQVSSDGEDHARESGIYGCSIRGENMIGGKAISGSSSRLAHHF